MPGDSVKVAVRVRPFNQREKNAGSKCIISMSGQTTTIKNPENNETKAFSFDHSYWSHTDFDENELGLNIAKAGSNYSDQRQVYNDLGKGVLDNAWQGYNAALFAYGQTGSGKSYSMIGYGSNKGIVPILCEELFKAVEQNDDKSKQLQVSFSMLEIYNEQVRDLLVKAKPQQGGLKIRQNPQSGFYVEGLRLVPVRNYKEIENLMEQGTVNRTTASTNMNATSSRSHMVITIRFAQVFQTDGGSNTRSSDINLVDLAGSERADSTGATGDRLKEGSAINQSLSTLGNVISALADLAMGKKKTLVPYRDSVLTKLLQSALGGNSRTIMIAALSPADINYDETLSTLRYADRAKKIQNKAVINESPTDRMIRELKEENAKLMALIKKSGLGGGHGMSKEATEEENSSEEQSRQELEKMLKENERKMQDMQLTWEQRLEQARKDWERSKVSSPSSGDQKKDWETVPYLTNINEDPMLSNVIKHCCYKGTTLLGKTGNPKVKIEVRGLGIQPSHAELININDKEMFLEPGSKTAKIFVNGHKVKSKTKLQHLDRLKFGSSCLYQFIGFPKDRKASDPMDRYNFDYFMMELAEHEGVAMDIQTPRVHESTENIRSVMVFQEFMDLMPLVSEANAISEELKKNVILDAEVKSEASHDPKGQATGKDVIIKVTNKKTNKVWIWSKSKFLHRKDLMDEMYVRWIDGENVIVKRDKDPFWDPVEDIFLGSAHILLQSLSYCVEIDEHFTLHNYHGKEEAVTQVKLLPCDGKGELYSEDEIIEPHEMIGKPFNMIFMLPQCMGIRWTMENQSRGIYCRTKFYNQENVISTKTVWGKSYADLKMRQQVTIKKVTEDFLRYLQSDNMVLELWGTQVDEDKQLATMTNGHSNGTSDDGNDMLTQLQRREEEIEGLHEVCDTLKKENFGLLKKLEMQKQATAIANSRRSSTAGTRKEEKPGLDVDLAKSLKNFFKDIKFVQHNIQQMKQNVDEVQQSKEQNGNLLTALELQQKQLHDVDLKLNESVRSLKESVATVIKKSKS
ncbi:kinesin-like protein KIF28 isoform X4 [Mytilus galloprovincialis]|uniref:kinesin-like protein KIF28 isoform X4 n=1 Tax=Mytilus galloprovincialis TaxID=29158 RepID=UPI003F7B6B9A